MYDFLKENFLKKEKKHHDKIYISRGKTNTRNINNEEEVVSFLKERGFNRIYMEAKHYNYSPIKNVFYKIDNHHYRINDHMMELTNNYENCLLKDVSCNEEPDLEIRKTIGKYVYIRKK